MSKFQLIVLGIFIIFIIAGVAIFATYKGNNDTDTQLPAITVWGTFPSNIFDSYISKINQNLTQQLKITYIEKSQNTFSQEFVSALARGIGPDAILIPTDMVVPHFDKIVAIPYSALNERTFKNAYIEEGEMYLLNSGILAIPFAVDPLVMYWNRDSFSAAGFATYPKYWDEFDSLNKALTVKDENGNIRRTALAFGNFGNINNAREILGTLFLQNGNFITKTDENDVVYNFSDSDADSMISPLQFFSAFADPNNKNYSWNRAMPSARSAFLSGTLAVYFGFASELKDLRAKNPNLNFDVAPVPQLRKNGVKATYGKIYGLSIVRTSAKQNAVYQIFATITDPSFMPILGNTTYLPSVRRDIIAGGSGDAYITMFNSSALIAKSWLDIDPAISNKIFDNMVGSVVSGSKGYAEALRNASGEYGVALRKARE